MKATYQKRFNECAVACIKMILDMSNVSVEYSEVKKRLNGENNFFKMREILDDFNVKSSTFRINDRKLKNIDFSYTILHLKGLFLNHFVLLVKTTSEFLILDPFSGIKRVGSERKISRWSGYCLGIYLTEELGSKITFYNTSYLAKISLILIVEFVLLLLILFT